MQIRTAVLLCAGRATRLWPVTLSRPKALVRIANKPILHRILESLAAAGIERTVVVISPNDESIPNCLNTYPVPNIETVFVPQDKPRGLADATYQARELVGDEPFLLHLGDELIENGVTDFVSQAAGTGADASILVRAVEDPRHYGVAVLEGDRIVRVIEKPETPPSPYALVGLYVFTPSIFQAIASTPKSLRTGEVEITDAIQWLIDKQEDVRAVVFEKTWFDIGRFETLLAANRFYLEREVTDAPPPTGDHCTVVGSVVVAHSCSLVDCKIIGPCVIAGGCDIRESVIGPHVAIGDRCRIYHSRVEDSILGAACEVSHLLGGLAHSVLGDKVRLQGGGASERVQLHAGDRTYVELSAPEGR
ncbi:MAG: sugar phosphate nucleotidyltransferase [Armatimonadota bacterium]